MFRLKLFILVIFMNFYHSIYGEFADGYNDVGYYYDYPDNAQVYEGYSYQYASSQGQTKDADVITSQGSHIEAKSGAHAQYKLPPQNVRYVPVVVKQKKKGTKFLSISKGQYIKGGIQMFGKYRDLKSCMKACAAAPHCFAGDYSPWHGKCYFHSNNTACDSMSSNKLITHFKKVPCSVADAPRGKILLGVQLFGGILQKGVSDLPSCSQKCAGLGTGISPGPTDLDGPAFFGNRQLCFGINYDFSSHKCYFLINNFPRISDDARENFSLCPIVDDEDIRVPIDAIPNPTVITILLCPER